MQNVSRKLSGYGPSLIVLATTMLVLFAGPSAVRKLAYEHTNKNVELASNRLDNPNNILRLLNAAYRDIALMVEPSVVHISVRQLTPGRRASIVSSGSGWIFDKYGHIVTNYHVVKGAERIEVQLDAGELRDATIVGYDESTDIAVLKIAQGRLHPATIADESETVFQGDMVFAFGSPFDFRFSMSAGVVSGKGRSVGVIRDDRGNRTGYENFIQVDAAINPGNSGGPLTNFRGHVIGMNTAIATGRDNSLDSGQFAGIGLAIPLEMILPVVRQLIDTGVVIKGFLGVRIAVDREQEQIIKMARQNGFTGQGAVLSLITENEPADRAGLKIFDIITHVNGRTIESGDQLRSVISSIMPGENVVITYWRYDEAADEGVKGTLEVVLDQLNPIRVTGRLPTNQPLDRLPEFGIASMETNSKSLARQFDVEYQAGVMLKEVVPESFLDQQAEAGWTIVGVRDLPVRNVEEFIEVLRSMNLRRGARLDMLDLNGELHRVTVGPQIP